MIFSSLSTGFQGYRGLYIIFLAYKTDRHDIAEILLKVVLNTINYNH
jgi:hypothetical protein